MPSMPVAPVPAEEQVAGGLHQPLSLHHPLAVVGLRARAQVRLEHGAIGLLHLQEQWVVAVAADEQGDPAARADAADTDHLAGHVDDPVPVEQVAP